MNNNFNIEEILKKIISDKINEEIEKEINEKAREYQRELLKRKDKYISEIMNGIRIMHDKEPYTNSMNYKIIFENISYLKGEE